MVGPVSRWFECPRIMLRCLSPAFFLDYVSGNTKSRLTREWVIPMSFRPKKGKFIGHTTQRHSSLSFKPPSKKLDASHHLPGFLMSINIAWSGYLGWVTISGPAESTTPVGEVDRGRLGLWARLSKVCFCPTSFRSTEGLAQRHVDRAHPSVPLAYNL